MAGALRVFLEAFPYNENVIFTRQNAAFMPSSPSRIARGPGAGAADDAQPGDPRRLGARLAALRKLNGLTLEQLATRAETTKSYLSKLERGLSSPTIGTLLRLARALGVETDRLIGDHHDGGDVVVVKAADRVPFSRSNERDGYTYEAIAASRQNKAMVPFIMRPPHAVDDTQDLVSHAGEELIFLISGKMEIVFADRRVLMEAGDSVYFNASIPHRSRSIGKTPAQALVVVSDPSRRE